MGSNCLTALNRNSTWCGERGLRFISHPGANISHTGITQCILCFASKASQELDCSNQTALPAIAKGWSYPFKVMT
jgi:hypothetical protein